MSVQSIFSNPVSRTPTETPKGRAVAGFTQVFAAILSKQLRNTAGGDGEGPLATGGGTTGDVYGAFFDEAMGHALATSPAMKPLNQAIERELERHDHSSGVEHASLRSLESSSNQVAMGDSNSDILDGRIVARNGTYPDLSSDSQGPLLLPPEPAGVASVLPPPPRLGS